ncbi:MAG TPA: LPS assembly lipoprotein LptE [Phycisphaerales bacterium]|nr:LPS assembly lipoprotein LptE [Phycisphaerales bacterium]
MIKLLGTIAIGACLVVAAFAGACAGNPKSGYTVASAYRSDIRTVSVPIFDNTTYEHNLEAQLTDAIVKEIHRTTPWRVVPPGSGQTTLSGVIVAADLRKLTTQGTSGLVETLAVDMSVNFDWKENKTGQVLVARRNFRSSRAFAPALGAKESLESGQSSTIDQLAKDIVAELRSSW